MTTACDIGTDVSRAARLLREGGVVAFATETVYGLGAHALDATAVARVFAIKHRPHFDPLIVHIGDRAWLPRLAADWPDRAERLVRRFWPGPLSLVVPRTHEVPDLVTAGLPGVALRMPAHPLALALLRQADVPVAAPSANPFGGLSPTCAADVADAFGNRIDYILDGGPCAVGLESTVLLLASDRTVLLRHGGITREAVEAEIGPLTIPARSSADPDAPALAPGLLLQHYAPRKPLSLMADPATAPDAEHCGLLSWRPVPDARRFGAVEILSPGGDLAEAATGFFAALRRLDAAPVTRIIATLFPEQGLGCALNDRLRRAAASPLPAP